MRTVGSTVEAARFAEALAVARVVSRRASNFVSTIVRRCNIS